MFISVNYNNLSVFQTHDGMNESVRTNATPENKNASEELYRLFFSTLTSAPTVQEISVPAASLKYINDRNSENESTEKFTQLEKYNLKHGREFYTSYDPNTGLHTAAVLGGLLVLVILYVLYKTKCKRIIRKIFHRGKRHTSDKTTCDKLIVDSYKDASLDCTKKLDSEVPLNCDCEVALPTTKTDIVQATAQWIQTQPLDSQGTSDVRGIILKINPDMVGANTKWCAEGSQPSDKLLLSSAILPQLRGCYSDSMIVDCDPQRDSRLVREPLLNNEKLHKKPTPLKSVLKKGSVHTAQLLQCKVKAQVESKPILLSRTSSTESIHSHASADPLLKSTQTRNPPCLDVMPANPSLLDVAMSQQLQQNLLLASKEQSFSSWYQPRLTKSSLDLGNKEYIYECAPRTYSSSTCLESKFPKYDLPCNRYNMETTL